MERGVVHADGSRFSGRKEHGEQGRSQRSARRFSGSLQEPPQENQFEAPGGEVEQAGERAEEIAQYEEEFEAVPVRQAPHGNPEKEVRERKRRREISDFRGRTRKVADSLRQKRHDHADTKHQQKHGKIHGDRRYPRAYARGTLGSNSRLSWSCPLSTFSWNSTYLLMTSSSMLTVEEKNPGDQNSFR